MKMKYAVIGTGNIGRWVIRDVLESDDSAIVLALDIQPDSLSLAGELDTGGRVTPVCVDATDVASLAGSIEGAAVLVNTTDGSRCLEIMEAAIAAGVSYMDVHGTLLVEERFALSERARDAGITMLVGMGCSPGITNMLGAYGARHAPGEVSVEVEYMTFRSLNPSQGLLETALRQFKSNVRCPVYENGELTWHPPFSGRYKTRFPKVGEEVELVFTPHSEPITIPRFVNGLKRVSVRGTYHPSLMALLRQLYEFGLLEHDLCVDAEGKKIPFHPMLIQALMGDGTEKPGGIDPLYFLRVRVTGDDGARPWTQTYTVGHPRGWDPLPQARMTALPTSYTAQLIASKELDFPGVCGPEVFTDSQVEECLTYIEAGGLWIETASES
jgi:saccharopine dehydrogenase-like NADP-dependent oxidoreductase